MPRNSARNEKAMPAHVDPRALEERPLPLDSEDRRRRAAGKPDRRRSVAVNVAESPLTWLHARGHLSERQLMAGEKLRNDFEAAAMGAQVTMQWDVASFSKQRRSSHEPLAQSERMIIAKQRFDDAIAALGGDLSDIAWRVICANEAIGGAERALGWPQRSGKLVLKIALDRLAAHYRVLG